jgi:hypothetical protein
VSGLATRRDVLAGTLASLLAPSAMARAARGGAVLDIRRGMNLWPWFSLTREQPAPSPGYDWPPFQAERPVPRRSDLAQLAATGFDFVRLPVDPGPLLAFDGARRARLLGDLLGAVDMALASRLAVVVDLHPNEATHYWNSARYASGPDAPEAHRFLELVGTLAAMLGKLDGARVALELVNEPGGPCGAIGWHKLQIALIRQARAAAPRLPLVVTGACGSLVPGLEALDPTTLGDDNLIYTFHLYEPYVFSHQGATWMTSEPMYRYLNAVPWPASAGSLAETSAAVARRLAGDKTTPESEKRAIRAHLDKALRDYFEGQPGKPYVAAFLDRVARWADRHGIARQRVLLGEFGALRTDQHYVAAKAADRARYIRDVREAAEERGFAWAFWNYFDGFAAVTEDPSRRLDPAIMSALGLAN